MSKELKPDIQVYNEYGDDISFKYFEFPGGEVHVKLHDNQTYSNTSKDFRVIARIKNSSDFMCLAMLTEVLFRNRPRGNHTLVIPYFPYARQDRVTGQYECFSLKMFAKMVNALGYSKVTIYDPHSDVTPALIENCEIVGIETIVADFSGIEAVIENCSVVASDAGAAKKVSKIAEIFGRPMISCNKVRDPKTGHLSKFEVSSDTVPDEVFIFDDICDGGGTFVGIANELRRKGAKKVYLFVTHGIFSKGLSVFDGVIDEIYCTDSIRSEITWNPPENVFVYRV